MSYHFLDHTADIIIHAEGASLKEAFQQAALGYYDVITDLTKINPLIKKEVKIESEDFQSLLYDWIDQLIFLFDVELLISNKIQITKFPRSKKGKFILEAILEGEQFNINKHPKEMGVKAMTYSFMKIGHNYVEFTLDL